MSSNVYVGSDHSTEGGHQERGSIEVIGVEPLLSATQLKQGDGLVWADRSQPLLVTESLVEPNSAVSLEGPLGGEYTLHCYEDTFVLLPKYGQVSNPVRVKTTGTAADEAHLGELSETRGRTVSSEA